METGILLSTVTVPTPTTAAILPPTMVQKIIRARWAAVWAVKVEWDRAAVDSNFKSYSPYPAMRFGQGLYIVLLINENSVLNWEMMTLKLGNDDLGL